MTDREIKIPPFVQDYINKVDGNGLSDFVKISAEYQKEKDDYPGKYAEQAAHLNDFNRRTGQNRQLSYEDGLNGIDTKFKKQAYQTAKQHGYTGPDPNQPCDKEFTKQGEKFQSMIDDARQQQQEKAQQAEQQRETEQGQEKKNIDALKEQPPYKQNQPNVEFKGVQSSGTDEQREAFLKQVRQTREQQTQQQNRQPEI